jgi:hypothetical protein
VNRLESPCRTAPYCAAVDVSVPGTCGALRARGTGGAAGGPQLRQERDAIAWRPRDRAANSRHSGSGRPDAAHRPGGRSRWGHRLRASRPDGGRTGLTALDLAGANGAGNLREPAAMRLQSSASKSRRSAPAQALTRVALVTLWARQPKMVDNASGMASADALAQSDLRLTRHRERQGVYHKNGPDTRTGIIFPVSYLDTWC